MIEHHAVWYESYDGQIFSNAYECYDYELNKRYHESGVTLYIGDKAVNYIITNGDETYNEITDIYIDRSKQEENEAFYTCLADDFGYCLIADAIRGNGSHYRYVEEHGFATDIEEVK